ncbi:MAG: hypothetical protein IT380_11820 [Myxococcales bacterium]|nr:hypothetical protein [Myxococcales bacterium]
MLRPKYGTSGDVAKTSRHIAAASCPHRLLANRNTAAAPESVKSSERTRHGVAKSPVRHPTAPEIQLRTGNSSPVTPSESARLLTRGRVKGAPSSQ